MKVKVEIELDIPDELIGDNEWTASFAAQNVHDNLTGFATRQHFKEELDWVVRSQEDESSRTECERIAKDHDMWAHIINQASVTVTLGGETVEFDKPLNKE